MSGDKPLLTVAEISERLFKNAMPGIVEKMLADWERNDRIFPPSPPMPFWRRMLRRLTWGLL